MVNREYFGLAEVMEKGYVPSIHDILYLVENKIIGTRIRLFNVVGKFCVIVNDNGLSYVKPIKEEELSGLFGLPLPEIRTIIKKGDTEVSRLLSCTGECDYIELVRPIKLDFQDVVISREEKSRLENFYSKACDIREQPRQRSDDFVIEELPNQYLQVKFRGNIYEFGSIQGSIIKQLYEALINGENYGLVYGQTLLTKAGSTSSKISEVFKRKDGWRELISTNKQGYYRLNI